MKLLICSPAQLNADGTIFKVKKSFFIPLSVYLLAGLTPNEWEIDVVNEYSADIPFSGNYDLVGISASTLHSRRGFEIAAEFRKRGVKVVMGGFHPTLFPQETQEHCDSLVMGEAEPIWDRMLEDAAKGQLKPTYQAENFSDLSDQPVPRYDMIDKRVYMNDIMPVESSRGCPFNCDFCSVTQFYGNRYRYRPVKDVIRDIKATGSRFCNFVDDNIAGKISYSEELFEAMVPLNVFWMSQVSIKLADHERVLALAAKSGYRYAVLGLETLDESNLESVGKKNVNRVAEYVSKTRLFKKHGITVASNLMFGFDNDTPETFDKTYQFVVENRFLPNPYIITPYPGTRLFERMKEEGRILHTDYWKYSAYTAVFQMPNFTPEEIETLFLDFYKRVFSIPNTIKRFFHMLRFKFSYGHFMTQVAMAVNSLIVRRNLKKGVLPYY
jgi:radical SAM superfamily enzyme YgiQ (UPF0313 family)